MNQQTDLIFEWRARITKLLTESLSASDGENADGEEYARTLETQGEAEAYLQAYAALLADRREILVAERTALATYDAREKKFRKTYAAAKAQQPAAGGETAQTFGDDEMAPEHEVLQDELAEKRKNVRKGVSGRAVKSISVDLHGVATSISDNQDPERIIANEWSNKLKALIREQCKCNFSRLWTADFISFLVLQPLCMTTLSQIRHSSGRPLMIVSSE